MKPWEKDWGNSQATTAIKPWEKDWSSTSEEPTATTTATMEPEKKGVLGQIGENLSNRISSIQNTNTQHEGGLLSKTIGQTPEDYQYRLRMLGDLTGGIVNDIAGPIIGKGLSIAAKPVKALADLNSRQLKEASPEEYDIVKNTGKAFKEDVVYPTIKKISEFKESHPDAYKNIEAAANVIDAFGMAYGATKLLSKPIGEAIENTGKSLKLGDTKIKDSVAKKAYGNTLIEKKKNIVDDIAEFGLTGTHEAGAEKAMAEAVKRFDEVDNIAIKIGSDYSVKTNPILAAKKDIKIPEILPDGSITGVSVDDLKKLGANVDEIKKIPQIVNEIEDGFRAIGVSGETGLDGLVKAKQSLNIDGKLFLNGPAGPAAAEPLKTAIKRKMYLNLVDEIGEISPATKQLNKEAKRLLDANAALSSAASRTANKDAISLTDWIWGTGGIAAAMAEPGSLAITVPIALGKKAVGGGRGSSAMISLGRKLQGKKIRTIGDIADEFPVVSPYTINSDLSTVVPIKKATEETLAKSGQPIVSDLDLIPAYKRKGSKLIDPKAESAANRFGETLGGKPLQEQSPVSFIPSEESVDRAKVLAKRLSQEGDKSVDIVPNRFAPSIYDKNLPEIVMESADKVKAMLDGYPITTKSQAKAFLGAVGIDVKDMPDTEIIDRAIKLQKNIGGNNKSFESLKNIFASESDARKAGYGKGDRVRIKGFGLVELD